MPNPFAEYFKKAGLIDDEKYEKLKKQEELESKKNEYGDFVTIYKDWYYKNGKINPNLFEQIAIDIVNLFKNSKLTSTKLRQYYDIVNNLYKEKIYNNEAKLKSELYLMLAKANYDYGRKQIVPLSFIQFIRYNLKEIVFNKDGHTVEEKFKLFKKHFEAIVAYSKWVLKE